MDAAQMEKLTQLLRALDKGLIALRDAQVRAEHQPIYQADVDDIQRRMNRLFLEGVSLTRM